VAGVLLQAVSVDAAMQGLAAILRVQKRRADAMTAALEIVMGHPPGQEGFFGPASREMARLNLLRRAQFAVSAMKRLTSDATQARSQNQSAVKAILHGMSRERRYYALHLMAIWGRSRAGAQVDSASMTYGRMLGWHTVRDRNTSPECLAANGKNFYADHMPLIGYPGAVHPNCRCLPGAPFPGARLLPSYGMPQAGRYRRAA
jgi:hypothetical protein